MKILTIKAIQLRPGMRLVWGGYIGTIEFDCGEVFACVLGSHGHIGMRCWRQDDPIDIWELN